MQASAQQHLCLTMLLEHCMVATYRVFDHFVKALLAQARVHTYIAHTHCTHLDDTFDLQSLLSATHVSRIGSDPPVVHMDLYSC